MKTITVNIYEIGELSEAAQKAAHENWLASGHGEGSYGWHSENVATLKAFEAIFPVDVRGYSYDAQTSDISAKIDLSDDIAALTGQRLATYLWNNYGGDLWRGKYYGKLVSTLPNGEAIPVSKKHPAGMRHVIRHSKCQLEASCVLTGYAIDENILQPIYEFIAKPDSRNFGDLLNECLEAWAKACKNDCAACESFEYFIDHAGANNYEFTETGELI